jgi:prepilin-type N-terminal cleavage/methylation domain-containing protein
MIDPTFTPSSKNAKGFTLIELLVAVGVTALLVSLMLTIVVNVMGSWSRSSGLLTSGNQARLVLDQLSRDLQSAILRKDTNAWLAATIQETAPGIGDWAGTGKPAGTASSPIANTGSLYIPSLTATPTPVLEDYRFGQGGTWLRFISSIPDTNTAGQLDTLSAPRAVSYQIVRQSVVSGSTEKRYLLFRSEISPSITFSTGYNLFDSNYYTGTAPTIRTPLLSNVIANNVVDFGVRFYGRNTSGVLVAQFPTTGDGVYVATTDTTKVEPTSGYGSVPHVRQFPEYAEVFIRILTDEGVNQVALMENPPSGYVAPGTWWDVVLANSRVYTRRIEIKAKGL